MLHTLGSRLNKARLLSDSDLIEESMSEFSEWLIELQSLDQKKWHADLAESRQFYSQLQHMVDTAVALYIELIISKKLPLTSPSLLKAMNNIDWFHQLFFSCSKGSLDFKIEEFIQDRGGKLSPDDFNRLMLLYSPSGKFLGDIRSHYKTAPFFTCLHMLGSIASYGAITKELEDNRDNAILFYSESPDDSLNFLKQVNPGFLVSKAWMRTSYSALKGKHKAKKVFNEFYSSRATDVHAPAYDKNSKRMVVFLDAFTKTHSFYRCFSLSLAKLKENFHVTAIGYRQYVDENTSDIFDELLFFDDQLGKNAFNFQSILNFIEELKPNVLFYPLLGMSMAGIMCSTKRLAPLQIQALGHPATSYSEYMDYVLIIEDLIGEPDQYSEAIVAMENYTTNILHDHFLNLDDVEKKSKTIDIAVPAVLQKLNYSFLSVLEEINNETGKEVRFHFFTGSSGIAFLSAQREIHKLLPTSLVHPYMAYEQYIKHIKPCDFHISSFPFGGTNSVLDSLCLGLPVVNLKGRESHELVDALFVKQANLDEWLSAPDKKAFKKTVLRLIEEDDTRIQIREKLADFDFQALFGKDSADSMGMADAITWLVNNHEKIQKSGKKIWSIDDRKETN